MIIIQPYEKYRCTVTGMVGLAMGTMQYFGSEEYTLIENQHSSRWILTKTLVKE